MAMQKTLDEFPGSFHIKKPHYICGNVNDCKLNISDREFKVITEL